MDPRRRPIRKPGERNIFCPFYNGCLDYAIENSWRSWNCSQCPYRDMQTITECGYDFTDPDPYYDLSVRAIRERIKGSSD
jgi:hypothetical protein